ncbi:MAG: hypothetical protein V1735_06285 [Nanoarchaeota archaeon]
MKIQVTISAEVADMLQICVGNTLSEKARNLIMGYASFILFPLAAAQSVKAPEAGDEKVQK